jgi:hypothetical protein
MWHRVYSCSDKEDRAGDWVDIGPRSQWDPCYQSESNPENLASVSNGSSEIALLPTHVDVVDHPLARDGWGDFMGT